LVFGARNPGSNRVADDPGDRHPFLQIIDYKPDSGHMPLFPLVFLTSLLSLSFYPTGPRGEPITTRRISPKEMELVWNITDPEIRKASDAVVVIQDGKQQRSMYLDATQIRRGALRYAPRSWDVSFRLRLFNDGHKSSVEEIRVLWSEEVETAIRDLLPAPIMQPAMPAGPARKAGSCEKLSTAEVDALVSAAAARQRIDPRLIRVVMQIESAFRPCAVSAKGASGLMQLMPATAREYGVSDPFNPRQNVGAGARYLRDLLDRYDGNLTLALSAYNAGPGTVDLANGTPDIVETQKYVKSILTVVQ